MSIMSGYIIYLGFVLALVTLYCLLKNRSMFNPKRLPLPPGPPGDFLIGHALKIPPTAAHFKYAEWAKVHGARIDTGWLRVH